MINKIILITSLFIFCSFAEGQSIYVYPKKGGKIKMTNGITLMNGSVILKDSTVIKKVIPLKYVN